VGPAGGGRSSADDLLADLFGDTFAPPPPVGFCPVLTDNRRMQHDDFDREQE
jgi:hypothetical protein